jgi:hypothetical protein
MSLINDALKRAKQAQQMNPPAPGSNLQLRPKEPAPSNPGSGKLLFATFAVILVVGAISLWQAYRSGRSQDGQDQVVDARSPGLQPGTSVVSAPKVVPPPVTNPPAPVVQVAPPPPRLQAIFFSPTRPSAIISGKTVFVGDRFREYRVIQIGPGSATLASATATNVLTLK